MKGLIAIYRREVAGLFLSPLAWILFCVTLFYNALFFLHILRGTVGEVNDALSLVGGGGGTFWLLIVVLPPLLTMRMISEESRSGLLEYLLTAPVGDGAVVVGKALAATTFLALVWACVPFFGLCVHLLGAPPDWGILFTSWVGATLICALFCSLGLVASAGSSTPLVAAFGAIVANILVLALPFVAGWARGPLREPVRWAVAKVDVLSHYQGSFMVGSLDSAHVVFFLAWTAALLFLAVRLVESRRWR